MVFDPKIDYDATTVGINALADVFDSGGTLTFYTVGSGIPTNADDAITDQVSLCAITTPTPSFGAGANGVVAKAGTWSGSVGTTGTPAFFRLVSGTSCWQGTVGIDTGDFDLEFANVTWLSGGTVTVSTFTGTLPRE